MKKFFASFFAIYLMMIGFAPQIVQASSYSHSSTAPAPIGISIGVPVSDLASSPRSGFFLGGFFEGILHAISNAAEAILDYINTTDFGPPLKPSQKL